MATNPWDVVSEDPVGNEWEVVDQEAVDQGTWGETKKAAVRGLTRNLPQMIGGGIEAAGEVMRRIEPPRLGRSGVDRANRMLEEADLGRGAEALLSESRVRALEPVRVTIPDEPMPTGEALGDLNQRVRRLAKPSTDAVSQMPLKDVRQGIDKFAKDVAKGVDEARQKAGALLSRGGAEIQDIAAKYAAEHPEYDVPREWAQRTVLENLKEDPVKTIAILSAENWPNMLATVGAYVAGGPGAAALTSIGLEGGDQWTEGKEYLVKKYGSLEKVPDAAWAELAQSSTAVGLAAGSLDFLPIANLFKRAGLSKEFTGAMMREAAKRPVLRQAIIEGTKTAGQEIPTEVIQELIQIAGQEAIGNNKTLEEKFNQVLAAAVAAGPSSFVTGSATGAAGQYQARKQEKARQEREAAAAEAGKPLDDMAQWEVKDEQPAEPFTITDPQLAADVVEPVNPDLAAVPQGPIARRGAGEFTEDMPGYAQPVDTAAVAQQATEKQRQEAAGSLKKIEAFDAGKAAAAEAFDRAEQEQERQKARDLAAMEEQKRAEEDALADFQVQESQRMEEVPTAMREAFAKAKKVERQEGDIVRPNGQPFSGKGTAQMYIKSKKIEGYEPVQVGKKAWVVRKISQPKEEQPNAVQDQKATQLYGDVQQQQRAPKGEGQMSAGVGGEEIPESGQAEAVTRTKETPAPAGVSASGDLFSDRAKQVDIEDAAHEAATSPKNDLPEPTQAQKEAGNYKKGSLTSKEVPWLAGIEIMIENPAGSKRSPQWPALKNHYGYFRRTEAYDGDEVDVFIGPDMAEKPGRVFVVNQVDPSTGAPDEHKVILGVSSEADAKAVYLANYSKGWKGLGSIESFEYEDFKQKLKSGYFKNSTPGRKAQASESVSQKTEKTTQESNQDAQSRYDQVASFANEAAKEGYDAAILGQHIVDFLKSGNSPYRRTGDKTQIDQFNEDLKALGKPSKGEALRIAKRAIKASGAGGKKVAKYSRRQRSRTEWADFPDAIIQFPSGSLQKHADYDAAKGGDTAAAGRLVLDLVTGAHINRIAEAIGDRSPIVVGVHAEERVSVNEIPHAYAWLLSERLGLPLDESIFQAQKIGRGGSDGFYRLANHPTFEGDVQAGKDYLIVDDTLTQGGTIAALKGYIEANGGRVVLASTLTGKQYSAKLAPSKEALSALRERWPGLEDWWIGEFGYGYEALTESEARYLSRVKVQGIDALREKILAARQARGDQGTESAFPPSGQDPGGITSRRASPGEPAAGGFSVSEIRESLQGHFGKRSDKIEVVQSEEDLPGGDLKKSGTTGVYLSDKKGRSKIYLVADNLNPANAPGVALHEALHSAIENDPKLQARKDALMKRLGVMQRFSRKGKGKMAQFFREAEAAVPKDTKPEHRLEEMGAYAVDRWETGRDSLPQAVTKWVQDLIATVRMALFKAGLFTPKTITPADLAALARSWMKRMPAVEGMEFDPATGALHSREAGGTIEGMTQKEGSGDNLTEQSPEPESEDVIVSGQGDDLVTLYHGTTEEGAASIRADGRIDAGRYFGGIEGVALTPRKEIAEEYADGGEVITVKVPKDRLVVDPESYDGRDIDEALADGASVYATGPILLNPNPSQRTQGAGEAKYSRRQTGDAAKSKYAEQNRLIREEHVTAWAKGRKWLKRQLTPGGLLPDKVFREKIKRDSEFEVIEFDVAHMIGRLESAIKRDYGEKARNLDETTQRLLSDVMAGKVADSVPEGTKAALLGMRSYIDGLTMQYLDVLASQVADLKTKGADAEAQAQADLIETIMSNVGQYVHRSYRAFDDKNWARKVSDEVLDNAREYLLDRYAETDMTEAEAERRAEVVLNEILKHGTAYESMEGFIRESKLGAKDLSVLKKRKQVAPEIRALLGEYTDPRINFSKSATKMGRLIFNQKFLDRVLEFGEGEFLWTDETKPPEATVQIAGEKSEVYAPLNGMWTTPDVAQAFKDALGKEQMADWYRTIVQLNGAIKFGKTILSPTTSARNWMSAFFFSIANGHFDMRHMAKSVSGLREYFGHGGDAKKLAYLRELKKLGVVYDTPYAGEMMRLLADSRIEDTLLLGKRKLDFKQALELAQKMYAYGDDFHKIIGFESEKRRFLKLGLSEQEAKEQAAERIRNTYPTYSMVGRGIQSLRRFPLAGTFVSFPAEIIRTSGNMLRYLAQDMKDPKTRPMARQRAVGLAVASSFAYGLQAVSMAMLGYDDDDDEAVRQMASPWQRNSNLLYTGRDKDGNIRYMDLSFLDPYNYWKRPIMAIARNQPWEDSARDVAKEMLTPFLGTDIAAGAIFEVLANKKESGGPVYKEHDEVLNQVADIADHLRKALQPGLASNLERTWKAIDGEVSPSGRKYDKFDEAAAWVGFRMSTLDPKVALYYRSFDFKDAKAAAGKKLRDVIRKQKGVDSGDLRDAVALTIRLREKAYREMILLVESAKKAGMSRSDIARTLKNSGVSRLDIGAILHGKTPPYRPTQREIQEMARKARTTFGPGADKEVVKRYREVISYARSSG